MNDITNILRCLAAVFYTGEVVWLIVGMSMTTPGPSSNAWPDNFNNAMASIFFVLLLLGNVLISVPFWAMVQVPKP